MTISHKDRDKKCSKRKIALMLNVTRKTDELLRVSEVGFEPTPSIEDQKTVCSHVSLIVFLKSGALNHSAILTVFYGPFGPSLFKKYRSIILRKRDEKDFNIPVLISFK